jgi:uncharacterized iron-regulated membrane protein
MRRVSLFVHRWLGLTAGLIFGIAALTGSVLVYEQELNSILGSSPTEFKPGLADPSAVEQSFLRQHPGHRLLSVEWPTPETRVFAVRATDEIKSYRVELDSVSAREIASRPSHPVLSAIRRLHGSLLLGRIGSLVVTYSTIASIVSLLLGVYLWWPGIRNMARGFKLRLRKGLYPLTYDAHQVSGVVALPLLLVMSITGVLRESALLRGFTSSASWSPDQSVETSSQTRSTNIGLAAVVRSAQNATAGAAIRRVMFPAKPDDPFEVWTEPGAKWFSGAATRVAVDRFTGAVLAQQDLVYDSRVNDRLHFALVGGPVVRFLYAVSSLIGAALFLTGVVMWWKRPIRRWAPLT